MDYEKAYKEALERAKVEQETYIKLGNVCAGKVIETIFPELKESEDENIRKAIKEAVEYYWLDDTQARTDIIAWLEKQGKREYALSPFKDEDVCKFMQYIEKEAKAYEFNLPNRGYDIYAFAKDILIWLEKQGEQKNKINSYQDKAVGAGYLQDWYQNSVDETVPPVWTDAHIEELLADFYVIPKR